MDSPYTHLIELRHDLLHQLAENPDDISLMALLWEVESDLLQLEAA